MFKGKLDINELKNYKSEKDITKLYAFLVGEIEMNEKRVQNALKKYHNNY